MRKGVDLNSIIEVSLLIIDHEGVEQLTIRKVADDLNIKPPSLYNHVKNLDQIIDYCTQESLSALHDVILSTVKRQKTVHDTLYGVAYAYRDFAKKFPGKYNLTQAPQYWKSEASALKAEETLKLIMSAIDYSERFEKDLIYFIRNFRSYLHGFIVLELSQSFQMTADIEESFKRGLEMFIRDL